MITIIDAKRFPASEAWKTKCKEVAEVFLNHPKPLHQVKIKEIHLCDHVQMILPVLLPHLEAKETDLHKLSTLAKEKVWIPNIPVCAEYIEGFIELSVYEQLEWKWSCKLNTSIKFTLFYSCEGTILHHISAASDWQPITPLGKDTASRQRFLLRLRNGGWL